MNVIPFNFEPLDNALGIKGLPRGFITEIFGREDTGKTYLVHRLIAQAQQDGYAAMITGNNSLNISWLSNWKVNPEKVYILKPETMEDCFNMTENLLSCELLSIIVVDSLCDFAIRSELESDMGDSSYDSYNHLIKEKIRRIIPLVYSNNTCMVITNYPMNSEGILTMNNSTFGETLENFASIRINLKKTGIISRGNIKGHSISAFIEKNRFASPSKVVDFGIMANGQLISI